MVGIGWGGEEMVSEEKEVWRWRCLFCVCVCVCTCFFFGSGEEFRKFAKGENLPRMNDV